MKFVNLVLFVLSTQFAFSQQARYDSLVSIAQRDLFGRLYEKSAENYLAAFKSLNYKGFAPDRFNAAKALAMSGNIDSAFQYLTILWKKTEYIETDSLLNEKMLIPLQSDGRWKKLIAETTPRMPELAKKLATIRAADQEYRQKFKDLKSVEGKEATDNQTLATQINTRDSINQAEVFAIIDKYGWLGREDIGNTGCSALYVVILHAPIEAQEKYFPIMKAAVKEGRARRQNLAYLEDRMLVRRGKKQLYGSQFKAGGKGYFPIADIEHLNERRAYVGLVPFSAAEMTEIKRQSLGWK